MMQTQQLQLRNSSEPSSSSSPLAVRNDWNIDEVREILARPVLDLVFDASRVHREHFPANQVQKCTLLSVKTGGCPETCGYCSQSSSWSKDTKMKATPLMDLDGVLEAAKRAKEAGSTRFCMGAAWRGPSQVGPRQWNRVLSMVSEVRSMGMEVCATLGMLEGDQATQLKDAGLTAYNHNIDTSREHYPNVTSSRSFDDRLETIKMARDAGLSVCTGGILGLGEDPHVDRASFLHTLATMETHPESVPVNSLVAVPGTPLGNLLAAKAEKGEGASAGVPPLDLVRVIAAARILMPRTTLRLSAGRSSLSRGEQALAFLAGANSIFTGDTLLTTPNVAEDDDTAMFRELGLQGKPPFQGAYKAFE